MQIFYRRCLVSKRRNILEWRAGAVHGGMVAAELWRVVREVLAAELSIAGSPRYLPLCRNTIFETKLPEPVS